MLCFRQFAFPHNALMLFACALDAVFELPPIVRQLLGHFIGSARHIATDCADDVHGLANLEFIRQHRTSVPTAKSKRLTATANRLILAADERPLQIDLVRLDRTVLAAGCVASRGPCPSTSTQRAAAQIPEAIGVR